MANTFVNVSPEAVKSIIEEMNKRYEDRTVVLSKPLKFQTFAPTTKRKTHKIKLEVELPLDAFKDSSAITDFGAVVLLHINDKFITPEFSK
jgi:hypothetical protein